MSARSKSRDKAAQQASTTAKAGETRPGKAKPAPVKDRAATSEKLMEAGLKVFSQRGYKGASVKEIAAESGVNVSLINRYFGGKEGLFFAIVERFIANKQAGELGYPPQATVVDEINEYLKFRLAEDRAHRALIRILISQLAIDQSFRDRVLASMSGGSDGNFRQRLQDLQATGAIPPSVDLDDLFSAVSFFSFSANFLGDSMTGRPVAELERLFEVFANTYAAGLGAA